MNTIEINDQQTSWLIDELERMLEEADYSQFSRTVIYQLLYKLKKFND